ncbi:putative quinol monooxygenase [Fulvivirga lutea]|uniref:Antibiotic biosynthesis monooxygenase n=1 Tax=Fulvivirga lutea TaxID=2810512 RepID=A0A974WFF5_9BACT|nr:antibiotic biosynthesis monooxygenase family protein [Fulvivirga lutea]QSE96112.1 antibiotic biosynthesis monooxygenase [Fulvivirga lutea]
MLIRVVRMTFEQKNVDDFLAVFNESKDRIRNFPGCQHLELLKDYNQPNIFSTYSIWDDETALDAYRHSELFEGVWAKTKALFSDKPMAFSSKKYIEV